MELPGETPTCVRTNRLSLSLHFNFTFKMCHTKYSFPLCDCFCIVFTIHTHPARAIGLAVLLLQETSGCRTSRWRCAGCTRTSLRSVETRSASQSSVRAPGGTPSPTCSSWTRTRISSPGPSSRWGWSCCWSRSLKWVLWQSHKSSRKQVQSIVDKHATPHHWKLKRCWRNTGQIRSTTDGKTVYNCVKHSPHCRVAPQRATEAACPWTIALQVKNTFRNVLVVPRNIQTSLTACARFLDGSCSSKPNLRRIFSSSHSCQLRMGTASPRRNQSTYCVKAGFCGKILWQVSWVEEDWYDRENLPFLSDVWVSNLNWDMWPASSPGIMQHEGNMFVGRLIPDVTMEAIDADPEWAYNKAIDELVKERVSQDGTWVKHRTFGTVAKAREYALSVWTSSTTFTPSCNMSFAPCFRFWTEHKLKNSDNFTNLQISKTSQPHGRPSGKRSAMWRTNVQFRNKRWYFCSPLCEIVEETAPKVIFCRKSSVMNYRSHLFSGM